MDIDLKIFNILTDEQKKAVEEAQTPEELLALAKETGYELSEEQMENIAGGINWSCLRDCQKDTCLHLCDQF